MAALEISGMDVEYDGVRAVSALSLEVDEGEIVALIGATAGRLREALEKSGPPHFLLIDFPHLAEAFDACRKAMTGGGTVALSPACASFGLFRNYKERGEAFLALTKSAVG